MACEHNSGWRADFKIESRAAGLKLKFGPDLYRNLAPRVRASWARGLEHLGDRRHVNPADQTAE